MTDLDKFAIGCALGTVAMCAMVIMVFIGRLAHAAERIAEGFAILARSYREGMEWDGDDEGWRGN